MSHLKAIVLLIVYFSSYSQTFPIDEGSLTELEVSLNEADEQNLQSGGFKKIDVDLNKGAGGNTIYLWHKRGSGRPITRLQVTFNDDMAVGLINAGYTKINKDLNAGTGGDTIYLWYFKGQTEYDTPIVDIGVTTDAESEAGKIQLGWQRLGCDLNRNTTGDWIHMWVKREEQTYICDVDAADSFALDADYFKKGYIRVDENTNRGAGGSSVFIWYRQKTDPSGALSDLQVSTSNTEYQSYQQQGYTLVNVDLNQGTGGDQAYLWSKKDSGSYVILGINLLRNPAAVQVYKTARNPNVRFSISIKITITIKF